jgi:hypothetical protein|tara:strand:+ start:1037 stop:1915 length:879 start_codon:yes stop_codon:yes gene_type:complete
MKKTPMQRIRAGREARAEHQEDALEILREKMPEVSAQLDGAPTSMQYKMAGNMLGIMDMPEEQLNLITINVKALDVSSQIGQQYATYINTLQEKARLAESRHDSFAQSDYESRADNTKSTLERSGFNFDSLALLEDAKNALPYSMAIEGNQNYDGDISPHLVERSFELLDRFGVIENYRAEGMSEGELYGLAEGYAKFAAMKAEQAQDVKRQMGFDGHAEVNHALDDMVGVQEYSKAELGIEENIEGFDMLSLEPGVVAMSGDNGVVAPTEGNVLIEEQPQVLNNSSINMQY